MIYHVLGIGYSYSCYALASARWTDYDIEFDFADSFAHAAALLRFKDYVCVAICTDFIPQEDLDLLRKVRPVPIVVVPPSYDEAQRYACVHFGVAQYLHSFKNPFQNNADENSSLQNFLRIPCEEQKPLTIITVKDISVCLERRTVEVLGQPVKLTGMEFDILALLITNQRRVLTYGMILDTVWKEPFDGAFKKTVINHVYNLRKKLRVSPEVPNYIKNVHCEGYRFDIDNSIEDSDDALCSQKKD